MRVAAIDVGTNSTRLLVAEEQPGGFRSIDRRMVITRLGQGVDRTRLLSPEGLDRTLRTIAEYSATCGELGVSRLRVTGTSAVRDARNRDEFFAMDIGTFCETVIKSHQPLLVANALEDDRWRSAPEIQVGMVSYLGFPVLWPDGRMFGTICVLDDKTNRYSDLYQELLLHCRDVLQGGPLEAVVGEQVAGDRQHSLSCIGPLVAILSFVCSIGNVRWTTPSSYSRVAW